MVYEAYIVKVADKAAILGAFPTRRRAWRFLAGGRSSAKLSAFRELFEHSDLAAYQIE